MIIDLPATDSARINRALVDLRETGGSVALGRVLTIAIVTEVGKVEAPIAAANAASYEHPCRVIVLAAGDRDRTAQMDAQIRVGGDAGASEVIVVRLYGELADHGASVLTPLLLPDSPLVAWWPGAAPTVPATDPVGALAQRRITDVDYRIDPLRALAIRADSYRPGDTDLSWTRLTTWRGLLAAALDQPPHAPITSAEVTAAPDSASAELLAGWLALLLGCQVRRYAAGEAGSGLHSVRLERADGTVDLTRGAGGSATLTAPGQPQRELALPRRTLPECIGEELRRQGADELYADVLIDGVALVDHDLSATSGSERTML